MRWPLLSIVVTGISAALPVLADDAQDCYQGKELEIRIKGCSKIIERDPKDATAYHNRAVANELAGDTEAAIADYTKAIEIAPNNATAYENRGRAYTSKSDYTHAVADATKASELIAKSKAQPIGITPKMLKASAADTKEPTVPPKTRTTAKANTNVGWWSWLWGDAGQVSGKNVKPAP